MKLAVIGCGSIGTRHIRNLLALGIAASDISAFDTDMAKRDAAIEQFGLARPTFDMHTANAILICSPVCRHAEQVQRYALADRKAFFLEKPCCVSSSEFTPDDLKAADDLPHMVGFNWRFNREYQALKMIAQSTSRISLHCSTNMATWPGSYGDQLLECSHEIDLARHWLGDHATLNDGRRGDGWADLRLSTRARAAHVTINWASATWNGFTGRDLTLYDDSGAQWVCRPSQESIDASYVAEMREFLALVRGDRATRIGATLREALEVVKICEQVSAPKVAA